MKELILLIFILNISICNGFFNIDRDIKYNKIIDFLKLSETDKECLKHYQIYIKPKQSDIEYVSFADYLEYWWNSEESQNELLNRVCNHIYKLHPKPQNEYIRKRINI